MFNDKETVEVLKGLAEKNNGILQAQAVVDAAKNTISPLHKYFEWDDTKAAEQYRLEQARGLIQVAVTYLPSISQPVRLFVSLSTDRLNPLGGYRLTSDVMQSEGLSRIALNDALRDMQTFKNKHGQLVQLKGVIREIDSAAKKIEDAQTKSIVTTRRAVKQSPKMA